MIGTLYLLGTAVTFALIVWDMTRCQSSITLGCLGIAAVMCWAWPIAVLGFLMSLLPEIDLANIKVWERKP